MEGIEIRRMGAAFAYPYVSTPCINTSRSSYVRSTTPHKPTFAPAFKSRFTLGFTTRNTSIITSSNNHNKNSNKSSNIRMTTKPPHEDTSAILKREAGDIKNVLTWVGAATVVGGGIYASLGQQRLVEYITAYIVEYSLSVDNLFVFLLLFQFFKVPRDSQEKVLTWGVIGAAVMRLAFIFVGEQLEHRFSWVALVFAAILLYSSVKILLTGEDDDEDGEEDLSSNSIVAFSKKLFKFSDSYDGNNFWTVQNGVKLATPLLLTLICIELSDIVFALDSVPAVLGISDNTTVVYMSNIMAIMGLRSLFFVVEDAVANLRFLQPCLGIVLAFIGGKLAGGVFGYDIDTLASLGVVLGVLGGGVGLSYAFPEPKEEKNEIN